MLSQQQLRRRRRWRRRWRPRPRTRREREREREATKFSSKFRFAETGKRWESTWTVLVYSPTTVLSFSQLVQVARVWRRRPTPPCQSISLWPVHYHICTLLCSHASDDRIETVHLYLYSSIGCWRKECQCGLEQKSANTTIVPDQWVTLFDR